MIEKNYSKDSSKAQQILSTIIQADKKTVFHYLATTDGISNWFPQLSIDEEENEKLVLFDMGDGTFEKMALLDYSTNEHISYEWAAGHVEFHLEDASAGTKLTLTETLPIDFNALAQDFTGWYVQMQNVKSVSETGTPVKVNKEEIQAVRKDIETQLLH